MACQQAPNLPYDSLLQHANLESLTAILNRVRFFLDLATISHPTAAVAQILELSSGMREFGVRIPAATDLRIFYVMITIS